jgi:lipopolysaccharide cholinephosphotransferase
MEDFSEYNGPGTPLRKAQLLSVEILDEFDRVCKENGFTYWLDYGTLLGAIRHKGFVPWDDDIDVSMPLADFERFKKIGGNKLKKGFFMQTDETDPDSDMGDGLFKIRKDGTIFINDFDDFRKNYHKGASIDVFADIPYPTISKGLLSFFRKRISKAWGFFHYNPKLNFKNIISFFVFPLSFAFFYGLWKLICLFKKKDREFTPIYRLSYGYPTLQSEMLPTSEVVFEGKKYSAPQNPHSRLTNIYGNYMVIPPKEKQRIHAKFICVDTHEQYVNL